MLWKLNSKECLASSLSLVNRLKCHVKVKQY
uniref:Uncharacterized protein n=1 Tax=Arundo donax TaxID=35708 RepID=A0A0A9H8E6_ARUDO